MNLRVDRIKNIVKTNVKARHFSEVSSYKNHFDSADYASKLFNMFSGEPRPLELVCENDTLEMILDKFGEKVKLQKFDDEHFTVKTNAAVSDGLVSWILQFGKRVKVVYPNDLAYLVKQRAEEILANYSEM